MANPAENSPPLEPTPPDPGAEPQHAEAGQEGAEQRHFLDEALEELRVNPPSSLGRLEALQNDLRARIRVRRTRLPDVPEVYLDEEGNLVDGEKVEKLKAWTHPGWWMIAPDLLPTYTRIATLRSAEFLLPTDQRAVRAWNRRWDAFGDRTEEAPVAEDEFRRAQKQIRAGIKMTAEGYEAENEKRRNAPHPHPLGLDEATVRKYERILLADHLHSVLRRDDWQEYKDDRGFTFDENGEVEQVPFVLSEDEQNDVRTTAGTTKEAFEKYKEGLAKKLKEHDGFMALREAAGRVREVEREERAGTSAAGDWYAALEAAVREALIRRGFIQPE